MKRLITGLFVAILLAVGAWQVEAQGSLSNQVLRLLTRDNTWSGVNIYTHDVGLTLQEGDPPTDTANRLYNVGGNIYWNGALIVDSGGGTGTVTSVALALPTSVFSIVGSPVTSSGNIIASFVTQSANTVFAGPTSGGAVVPAFRALVAADIPDLSATYVTPSSSATFTNKGGNISQWTNNSGYITSSQATLSNLTSVGTIGTGVWQGTVVAGQYGGTGVANTSKTITLGGNISTAGAFTTSGAFGITLTATGTTSLTLPTSGTLVSSTVATLSNLASIGTITTGTWNGTAVGATYGGTGQTSYTTGDILYASSSTVLTKLADVATGQVLKSGGVGVAPSWGTIDSSTTVVTGTLPRNKGGTGLTTANDDTTLVSNGTSWLATTLGNGVLSYNTSTNAFSVPTTFILGTGAPTASANNILLRSNINAVLEILEGNAADYADTLVRRLSIGGSGGSVGVFSNTSPVTGATTEELLNVTSTTLAASTAAHDYVGMLNKVMPVATVDITGKIFGTLGFVETNASDTETFAAWYGAYFAAYQQSSGTTTLNVALAAEANAGGSRTTTTNIGLDVLAKGSSTSVVTNNYGVRIQTPVKGTTMTNTYGIYIADQTVTSTLDYAFWYNAPSSKEFGITAAGQVIVKALMTTGSATGKKVVCVDTTTGQLYASSTGVDCLN